MFKILTVLSVFCLYTNVFAKVQVEKTDICQCEKVFIKNKLDGDFSNWTVPAFKIVFYTKEGQKKWESNRDSGWYPTMTSCQFDCKVYKGQSGQCE